MTDLTYTTGDIFTRFYPETTAGENVWREMAKQDGVAAVLNFEAAKVIAQIRRAGYSVAKAKKSNISVDDIFAELGA
jgi:hypothetical protein